MPEMYAKRRIPSADWPDRKAAWVSHYMAKGCHREKATECANTKRFKTSWPV